MCVQVAKRGSNPRFTAILCRMDEKVAGELSATRRMARGGGSDARTKTRGPGMSQQHAGSVISRGRVGETKRTGLLMLSIDENRGYLL